MKLTETVENNKLVAFFGETYGRPPAPCTSHLLAPVQDKGWLQKTFKYGPTVKTGKNWSKMPPLSQREEFPKQHPVRPNVRLCRHHPAQNHTFWCAINLK